MSSRFALIHNRSRRVTFRGVLSWNVRVFASSSTQKPKFSSLLDAVFRLGALVRTTFLAEQFRSVRASTGCTKAASAIVSTAHLLTPFINPPKCANAGTHPPPLLGQYRAFD